MMLPRRLKGFLQLDRNLSRTVISYKAITKIKVLATSLKMAPPVECLLVSLTATTHPMKDSTWASAAVWKQLTRRANQKWRRP